MSFERLVLSLPKELVLDIKKEANKSYRPVSKFIQMLIEEKLKEAK